MLHFSEIKPQRPVFSGEQTVVVVVPCYNEAERLDTAAFRSFVDVTPWAQVLFVNDGSTDTTHDVLRRLCRSRPYQMTLLDMPSNGGKAEAVRAGIAHAFHMDATLIAYWDADLATPLELIEDFVKVANRNPDLDVVFGSRRQLMGHKVRRTLSRRLVSRICAALARLAIGLPVADTQCGAKLLRPTSRLEAAVATPFSAGWLFDVELLSRISRQGDAPSDSGFYELPLAEWSEVAGSKVSPSDILKSGVNMLGLIIKLRTARLQSRKGSRPDVGQFRQTAI